MSELTVGSLKGLSANNFVIDVASGSRLVQPGSILQVVSTTKTDTFTTTSSAFVDVTGLTASITPSSASNKVFVSVSVPSGISSASEIYFMTLADDSNNNLIVPTSPESRTAVFASEQTQIGQMASVSFSFLHSPNTTSAFTYKVRLSVTGGVTAAVNRSGQDTNAATRGRGVSTITLMEVAG
jgi:hypothetical protein